MNILILVVITTWSFGYAGSLTFDNSPNVSKAMFVGSSEAAAIEVYNNEAGKFISEPNRYEYRLYEIDLENCKIVQIDIPKLSFTEVTRAAHPLITR